MTNGVARSVLRTVIRHRPLTMRGQLTCPEPKLDRRESCEATALSATAPSHLIFGSPKLFEHLEHCNVLRQFGGNLAVSCRLVRRHLRV